MQRRDHLRHQLWFPVQIAVGATPALAMTHNIGAGGMLMSLTTEIKTDEPVTVTFHLPPGGREYSVKGHILRVEPNPDDPHGAWPHRVAVAFDELAPELLPYLEAAVQRFSSG